MCAAASIFCIASGEQDDQMKFYFYARDSANFAYLAEITLQVSAAALNIVIKAQEGSNVAEFSKLFTGVLGPLIQTN